MTPTVSLSRAVDEYVRHEARNAAKAGTEIGGGLYGQPPNSWDQTVRIGRADPPTPTSRGYANGLVLQPRELRNAESPGERLVGIWHSHPSGGEPGMSRADVEVFGTLFDTATRSGGYIGAWIALIAAPNQQGRWGLSGWRFHREGDTRSSTRFQPVALRLHGAAPAESPQLTVVSPDRLYGAPSPPVARMAGGDGDDQELAGRDRHVTTRTPRRAATQHRRAGLYECIREFKALYGGEAITVRVGERVVAEHDLVRLHPDAFKSIAGPRPAQRDAAR